jgi:hypothetical protein
MGAANTNTDSSVKSIKQAEMSLQQEHSLLRTIATLPVGKAFMACATAIIEAATWTSQVALKLDGVIAKIRAAGTADDFNCAHAELRVAAMDTGWACCPNRLIGAPDESSIGV